MPFVQRLFDPAPIVYSVALFKKKPYVTWTEVNMTNGIIKKYLPLTTARFGQTCLAIAQNRGNCVVATTQGGPSRQAGPEPNRDWAMEASHTCRPSRTPAGPPASTAALGRGIGQASRANPGTQTGPSPPSPLQPDDAVADDLTIPRRAVGRISPSSFRPYLAPKKFTAFLGLNQTIFDGFDQRNICQ